MLHVAEVERSVAFYRLLGFEVGNSVPRDAVKKQWVWLYAPAAEDWKHGPNLMLTRSSRPLDASVQDALFYLYATNLESLRTQLLEAGLAPSEIRYPEYLPDGEFLLTDPDGYCLMIAQAADSTP